MQEKNQRKELNTVGSYRADGSNIISMHGQTLDMLPRLCLSGWLASQGRQSGLKTGGVVGPGLKTGVSWFLQI